MDGGGDDGDVGDDVDDDFDDARDDDDDDGDDLPFREVIFSPAESARRRWLFSSVGFCPVAAAKHGNNSSFRVSTPGGLYRRKGAPRGATKHPGGCLAGPGGGPRQTPFW